ncbi:hypothetical protein [Emticicia sp. 21SJ11W-3]|uniref:hypothetical protein n=1 Tax=Emticicia sp. 21SJ11W-3 TaxID=2916755 RepID=UPI0020A1FAA2|nr:hypothetical protein [Emticicia sp. 21SJ11W-3]UTA68814.1 hypothetical protein MB380_03190 [Emticicia sp. 21SJ11W-3]
MRNTFNYIKKALDNKIGILERETEVGFVQFGNFKTDVAGVFKDKKYLFKKKSFWSSNYVIYRDDNQQLIGEVIFSNWKRKAEISLANGEKFVMQSKNFWSTQWSLDDTNREVVDFVQTRNFWTNEGTITADVKDNEKMGLLVLLSTFVNFVYKRRAAEAAS